MPLEDWEYEARACHWRAEHSRKSHNRSEIQGRGNMKMNRDGDLSMVAPLTKHARKRAKERNISLNDAVKKHAVVTSKNQNAVIATVYKKNKGPVKQKAPPERSNLPSGHNLLTKSVPKQFAGHIIGIKGKKINAMKACYGVDISLVDNSQTTTMVHIWGPAMQTEKAWCEISSIVTVQGEIEAKRSKRQGRAGTAPYMEALKVKQQARAGTAPNMEALKVEETLEEVNFSSSIAPRVFGRSKDKVFSIAAKCNVRCEIRQGAGGNPRVLFWGKTADAKEAATSLRTHIRREVSRSRRGAGEQY